MGLLNRRQGIEFLEKRLAVIPRDILYWIVRAFEFRRIVGHDGFPQCLRYFMFSEPASIGELDHAETDGGRQ